MCETSAISLAELTCQGNDTGKDGNADYYAVTFT